MTGPVGILQRFKETYLTVIRLKRMIILTLKKIFNINNRLLGIATFLFFFNQFLARGQLKNGSTVFILRDLTNGIQIRTFSHL